ncbi:MAG: RDD family protein [Mucilaginibacter sp.]|uniref:RDD family protein n=1 Tax=Mucilaginibacter sp. TaxID=1882438 RepID=UPI0032650CD0
MDEKYLLVVNGKPEGPYSIDELKAMRIKAGDFVKTAAMDDYKEAHEIAELRSIFGFRLQTVAPQYFGAFDQRVLAAIIDWLIVGGIAIAITYIPVILISNAMIKATLTASLLVVVPIAYLIYHIVMEASPKQATYGKMILKIRVCNMDGSDIDTSKAIKRNVYKILSVLTFFVGYLMSFFNKKQQCLHDVIAETLVMRDRLV